MPLRLLGGLKVAGINLLVLALLLLLLETALRWLEGAPDPEHWTFQIDPVTGHAHAPRDFRESPNAAASLGRSRHFTLERFAADSPAGEGGAPWRILTLGGSTTDPLGERFSGIGGTWPSHLGRLAAAAGQDTEIANAGVGGFSSAQELLKLLSVLAFHEVDLVIALNGINEIYFERNRLLAEDDNLMASDIFLNNVQRGRESVIRHDGRTFVPCRWVVCIDSRVAPLLATAVEDLLAVFKRDRDADPAAPRPLDAATIARLDRAAAVWQRNVRSAEAVAAANGAAYVVVLQPTMGLGVDRTAALAAAAAGGERLAGFVAELLEDAYLERINHLYDRLQDHCANLAFCIDLARPQALPVLAAELYADPRHQNSDGNRIIARLVLEALEGRHRLEARDESSPLSRPPAARPG